MGRWSSSAEDEIPISFESARKGEQVLGLAGENHKWGFPPLKVSILQERYTPKFFLSNVGRGAATCRSEQSAGSARSQISGMCGRNLKRIPRRVIFPKNATPKTPTEQCRVGAEPMKLAKLPPRAGADGTVKKDRGAECLFL